MALPPIRALDEVRRSSFELLLCSTDVDLVSRASAGGVDAVVVDWESYGCALPLPAQAIADLRNVRAATSAVVIARLNRFGEWTPGEVERAVDGGADEVLLTMVRSVSEVTETLRSAAGRCRVGIVVETLEAVALAPRLDELPLSRVHLGLKDLAAARGSPGMFTAVRDGTVEAIRRAFRAPVGFGGITLPEAGDPIPARLLIGELVRIGCAFTLLRESFLRDIVGRDPAVEIPRLKQAFEAARQRSEPEVLEDRRALEAILEGFSGPRA